MICHKRLTILSIAIVIAGLGRLPALRAQTHSQSRDVSTATESQPASEVKHGRYYALVIGINNYHPLPALTTAVNDAKAVATLLESHYGFRTTVLLDGEATRDNIVGALDHYRSSLTEDDSLLIYYGGHGYFDKDVKQAYWAPVDAGQGTYARWIIATEIIGTANAIPARQVLIISDSCYSGELTRDAKPEFTSTDHSKYVDKMLQKRSRHLMASGGNEPVEDSDGSGHSVFAHVLLQALSEYPENQFTGEQLFSHIQEVVGIRAKQVPQYKVIIDSHSDGGDFGFFRTSGPVPPDQDTDSYTTKQHNDLGRIANSEEGAVFAALEVFARAFSSMDIRNLQQAWPSMTRQQAREVEADWNQPGLKAVMLELRPQGSAEIRGDTAVVRVDEWMKYTYRGRQAAPQTKPVKFQLARNAQGVWVVNDISDLTVSQLRGR